jgi:DNA-binding response OmpR family regulator
MDYSDLKVLIVDDNIDICEVLEAYFQSLQIYAKYVLTGKEAIDEIKNNSYNLILLDNKLPDINGIQILKRGIIKKEKIFVVVMTGNISKDFIQEAVKLGFNEFLAKPFKLTELNNILNKALLYLSNLFNFKEAVARINKNSMEIVTDNNIGLISSISKLIIRNVVDAGFFSDENQVLLALNEVLANAIFHGNLELDSKLKEESFEAFETLAKERQIKEPYKTRRVFISSYFDKNQFSVIIKDEGPGFDWKSYLKKIKGDHLLPYGRGLFIVMSLFDEITWNEKGNEIKLVKYKITN